VSVRLYRVTKNDPPTEDDMKSHWDLGHRPASGRKQDEIRYKEVSVFDTPEAAAAKARARRLGEYIAELEVPDVLVGSHNPETGHYGLTGTTPGQLLGLVQNMREIGGV
jgi:hypothetical protein